MGAESETFKGQVNSGGLRSGAPENLLPRYNLFIWSTLRSIHIRKAVVLWGLDNHFQIPDKQDEGEWYSTR